MKLLRVIPAILGMVSVAGGLQAAESANSGRTVVIFDHPEKFTDVRDRDEPSDAGQAGILAEIKRYIVYDASSRLPAGDTLTITFTDIKLAGDFEPWHGPLQSDIRYIRDIYPPAYKFSYVVTDAAGNTVKKGAVDFRDLDFNLRLTIDNGDPLHYEKAYLDEWIRSVTHDLK